MTLFFVQSPYSDSDPDPTTTRLRPHLTFVDPTRPRPDPDMTSPRPDATWGPLIKHLARFCFVLVKVMVLVAFLLLVVVEELVAVATGW